MATTHIMLKKVRKMGYLWLPVVSSWFLFGFLMVSFSENRGVSVPTAVKKEVFYRKFYKTEKM
jgi:hypothetical protein